jgi:hypothetical protein
MRRASPIDYHGSAMTAALRSFATLAAACALAGCATTADQNGAATTGLGLFVFCEPSGWTIDWPPASVPELRAPTRRSLEPRVVDVPHLPSVAGALALQFASADVPDLPAATRTLRPDPLPQLVPELPPSIGVRLLPATSGIVPELRAPERRGVEAREAPSIDLIARARSFDLGARYEPALETSRGCTPGLVLASTSCRTSDPYRAGWRDAPRGNP